MVSNSQFPLWDFFECKPDNPNNGTLSYQVVISQFPLWDFFECNARSGFCRALGKSTLNSLCGISSNATTRIVAMSNTTELEKELSIPFVGFLRMQQMVLQDFRHVNMKNISQFPLWDFFECNWKSRGCLGSILKILYSQFPLWDFFECNIGSKWFYRGGQIYTALNSLCGISSNATM